MKNLLFTLLFTLVSLTSFSQSATFSKSTVTSSCWTTNPVIATATQQNSMAVYQNFVYVVYYNSARKLCISRNSNYGAGSWKTIELPHTYEKRNDVYDSHNTPNIAISPNDKRIHLAFDLHKHELRYILSWANTATISDANFTASRFSSTRNYITPDKALIKDVTYPRFFLGKNDNLFLMYRVGGSGNGDTWMARYNDDAYWNAPFTIIDGNVGTHNGSTSRCAYFNDVQFKSGKIHLTWVWRETPDETTNHDLMYAYSGDNGLSWKNSNGSYLSLPMNLNSSGLKVATIATGTGLTNHNGCAIDGDDNVHTVLRINGAYKHYYKVGTTWRNRTIATFSGDRPKLYCDRSTNTLYLVVRQSSTLRLYATASNGGNWNQWSEITNINDKFTSTTNSFINTSGDLLSTMSVSSDGRLQVIKWTLSVNKSAQIGNQLSEMSDGNISDGFAIYPNPSNGIFAIELDGTTTANVSIYNMNGHLVYQKESSQPRITVDNSLQSGMYIVKILDDNRNVHVRKLIVE